MRGRYEVRGGQGVKGIKETEREGDLFQDASISGMVRR